MEIFYRFSCTHKQGHLTLTLEGVPLFTYQTLLEKSSHDPQYLTENHLIITQFYVQEIFKVNFLISKSLVNLV